MALRFRYIPYVVEKEWHILRFDDNINLYYCIQRFQSLKPSQLVRHIVKWIDIIQAICYIGSKLMIKFIIITLISFNRYGVLIKLPAKLFRLLIKKNANGLHCWSFVTNEFPSQKGTVMRNSFPCHDVHYHEDKSSKFQVRQLNFSGNAPQ